MDPKNQAKFSNTDKDGNAQQDGQHQPTQDGEDAGSNKPTSGSGGHEQ